MKKTVADIDVKQRLTQLLDGLRTIKAQNAVSADVIAKDNAMLAEVDPVLAEMLKEADRRASDTRERMIEHLERSPYVVGLPN